MKKKDVEIILSNLDSLDKLNIKFEQYQTESSIASDILWHTFMARNVDGKVIADLGCGNGIFGVGALLLGAKKVYFLDVDETSIAIAKKNVKRVEKLMGNKFDASFLNTDVGKFNKKVDLVIQNPPFGVKKIHADKLFLVKAMESSNKVYTFHKLETANFVENFVKDSGREIRLVKKYKFPLRKGRDEKTKGYAFWKKNLHFVDVGVWLIE